MSNNSPPSLSRGIPAAGVGVCVLISGLLLSRTHYLLFHSLAEIFSVTVAYSLFIMAWNSRQFVKHSTFLLLGVAYLGVGSLDLLHTLAYKGMGVFQSGGANLATQLWIASRYLESVAFLIAPFLLKRKIKTKFIVLGCLGTVLLLLGAIFYSDMFPDCFLESTGLTLFKKISEYGIALLLTASIVLFRHHRARLDNQVYRYLITSIMLTIGAELAFVLYSDVYDILNTIGHLLKIVSFYLAYKAIIETGLSAPYALLFRDLKQHESALTTVRDELERRIADRTSELSAANQHLTEEIAERRKIEEELRQYRDHLEHLVTQRTAELQALNKQLAQQIATQQQTEQALRKSEEKYRLLVENMDVGIGYYDTEGHVLFFNKRAAESLHTTPEESQGKSLFELFDKNTATLYLERIQLAAHSPTSQIYEDAIDMPSGRRWLLSTYTRSVDDQGQVNGIQIITNDITERKQAEEARQHEIQALMQYSDFSATAVTATTLNIMPLSQAAPEVFSGLVEHYERLLNLAMEERLYKVNHAISEQLRALANQLGFVRSGPRDVVNIHIQALKNQTRDAPAAKTQAYSDVGRLVLLELMGYLVTYYRNYNLGSGQYYRSLTPDMVGEEES